MPRFSSKPSHTNRKLARGCSTTRVLVTEVVQKDAYYDENPAREQACYTLGTLVGLPMVPGFIDDGAWHSVFVDKLVLWRNRIYSGSGFSIDAAACERIEAAVAEDPVTFAMAFCFDYLVSNADRHFENWGWDSDGKLVLFDHDHCLPDDEDYYEGWDPREQGWVARYLTQGEVNAAWKRLRRILTPAVIEAVVGPVGRTQVANAVERRNGRSPVVKDYRRETADEREARYAAEGRDRFGCPL